ncbi:hypothetical protein N8T08_006765 [Aspergillus melleus]|uniref:Uncharacterized protein n=1 Tax=Aspergillus melleus TaxID=138277 RepID=A0ACC3B0A7_9EURO|nr:hypothetical protein N8T08_006765 [Aspergillus melleus]
MTETSLGPSCSGSATNKYDLKHFGADIYQIYHACLIAQGAIAGDVDGGVSDHRPTRQFSSWSVQRALDPPRPSWTATEWQSSHPIAELPAATRK